MKSKFKENCLTKVFVTFHFDVLGAFIMLKSSAGVLKYSKYIIVLRSLIMKRCSFHGMIPVGGSSFTLPFSKFNLVIVSGRFPSKIATYLK